MSELSVLVLDDERRVRAVLSAFDFTRWTAEGRLSPSDADDA